VNDQSKDGQAILDWLSTENFAGRQRDILKQMTSATGDWLLKTYAFATGQASKENTLWCPGILGAGKTIIASCIINHLKCTIVGKEAVFAFVYCNYKEPDQTAETLVAALVRQLLHYRGDIPDELHEIYEAHIKEKTQPSLDVYVRLLRQQAQSFTWTFVIMDILDECKEQDGTRQTLIEAFKTIKPDVHLLVTSRSITSIENEFRDSLHKAGGFARMMRMLPVMSDLELQRHVKADPALESAKDAQNCHGV